MFGLPNKKISPGQHHHNLKFTLSRWLEKRDASTFRIASCLMFSTFILASTTALSWPGARFLLLLRSNGGAMFVPHLWIHVCLQLFLVDKLKRVARLCSAPPLHQVSAKFCDSRRNIVVPNRRATDGHRPTGASAPQQVLSRPKVSSDMFTLIRSGKEHTVLLMHCIVLNPASLGMVWEELSPPAVFRPFWCTQASQSLRFESLKPTCPQFGFRWSSACGGT